MSTWGSDVSITLPNSDLDVEEVFNAFKGLFLASGWSEESWKDHVCQLAMSYEDEKERQ